MDANIYGKKLILLPAPQCVVFYNGDEEIGDEQALRLSDAFTDKEGNKPASCLELTARMVNINSGHSAQLMAGCRRLGEYSQFVGCFKQYRQKGLSTDEAIDSAVAYCIDHGIMSDILEPLRAEVKKMLLTEYNEKKTMRLFRKEAWEEGHQEGRAEGRREGRAEGRQEERYTLINAMLQNGISVGQISKQTGLPPEEIERVGQLEKNRQSKEKTK